MKILISGGGTGGHIFPALAIANAVKRRDPQADILFVGALGRMEMERVPAAGYEIVGLPVAGFDRKRLWRNFGVVWKLWRSMRKAKKVLRDFQPDIAVGVGGYASGPMLKEAQKQGIPTLIQEQNSYAGVTNKLLAANAGRICVAYDGMERFFPEGKIVKTGNPVRKNIVSLNISHEDAKRELGFNPNRPLVVVVGGSLGARTINDSMKLAVRQMLKSGASVLWQTGKLYAEECSTAVADINDPNLQVTPFILGLPWRRPAGVACGGKHNFGDTARRCASHIGAVAQRGRRPPAQKCRGIGQTRCRSDDSRPRMRGQAT